MVAHFIILSHLKTGSSEDFSHMGLVVYDCVSEFIITALGSVLQPFRDICYLRKPDLQTMIIWLEQRQQT